ncbi:MAG TPA: hypothetical protein VG734_17535, partial [Lacunisphaera sp.]|nr:hypothetical protein [Lacunisphaera sp.]
PVLHTRGQQMNLIVVGSEDLAHLADAAPFMPPPQEGCETASKVRPYIGLKWTHYQFVERPDSKALARSGFAATRWGQRVPPFGGRRFTNRSAGCANGPWW